MELATQMAGPEVRIGAAGGLDVPGGALGTDAVRVLGAIEDVWSEDGVLVLMDLGSAVLSAELALDLLDEERRTRVLLTAAPLVEGAVAAAVAAGLGDPLDAVAAVARGGLAAKASHLGEDGTAEAPPTGATPMTGAQVAGASGEADEPGQPSRTLTVTVLNPLGLHARPAALLVRTAAGFDARVEVADVTNGRGPVSARSLNGVATLGARQGDELALTASGAQAAEALDVIRRLAERGFGELGATPGEAAPAASPSRGRAGSERSRARARPTGRRGAHRTARRAGGGHGSGAALASCRSGAAGSAGRRPRRRMGGARAGPVRDRRRHPRGAGVDRRPRRRRGRGHLRRPPALPRGRGPSRPGARRRLLLPRTGGASLGGRGDRGGGRLGHAGGRVPARPRRRPARRGRPGARPPERRGARGRPGSARRRWSGHRRRPGPLAGRRRRPRSCRRRPASPARSAGRRHTR